MCDTLIASPRVTENKAALFAKNSDRPPNEAQFLDWAPAQTYPPGESLQCTYIDIPRFNKLLLSYYLARSGCGERKWALTSMGW